ncbi:hypothetical protein D3C73_1663950 [compost metagenome]
MIMGELTVVEVTTGVDVVVVVPVEFVVVTGAVSADAAVAKAADRASDAVMAASFFIVFPP